MPQSPNRDFIHHTIKMLCLLSCKKKRKCVFLTHAGLWCQWLCQRKGMQSWKDAGAQVWLKVIGCGFPLKIGWARVWGSWGKALEYSNRRHNWRLLKRANTVLINCLQQGPGPRTHYSIALKKSSKWHWCGSSEGRAFAEHAWESELDS